MSYIQSAFWVFCLAIGVSVTAEDDPSDQTPAALDGLRGEVENALAALNVPGLGVAVVYADQVIYAEGIGQRDIENDLPMTAVTLFAIGSTTKAMTTTVLGMLVDEGLVDYDAAVREYIPEFQLKDPGIAERMTVRDLVTHRSGLPRHDLLWYLGAFTRAELLPRLAHLDFSAPHRQRWQYNNLMYMTAGIVTERVTGSSWEENVRARLFEPIGMTRSNLSVTDSQADDDHAKPYVEFDGELKQVPFRNLDAIGPAGSVNSSVREMTRWLKLNLRRGEIDGTRLISVATLSDIYTPHMAFSFPRERFDIIDAGYALGWWQQVYRGHKRLTHSGGIDGFTTSLAIYPGDGLGVVAFTNRTSQLPRLVTNTVADRLLGLEGVDWIGDAIRAPTTDEEPDEVRVAKTTPSHAIDDYAGTYQHPSYGEIAISRERSKLRLNFMSESEELEHWHYDVWRVVDDTSRMQPANGMKLQFRSDVDGKIVSVETVLETAVAPSVFVRDGVEAN